MPPDTSNVQHQRDDNVSPDQQMNQLLEETPFLDVEVSSTALFDGAYQVVSSIFPSWQREHVKFVQCKDGITNQLVRVTHMPTDFSVLVRAYGKGSELIIDRKQEVINLVTLSAQGLAPPLYARFRNGLMYGFIKGRVSTCEDMRDPKTAKWIARQLAKWHKVRLPQDQVKKGPLKQKLWPTMRSWLQEVPDKYDDPVKQQIFSKRFDKDMLAEELEKLILRLEPLNSPVVFSHNDLLYGNIIFDDEKEEAAFIDYEYGCYAFRGFDLGNHYNEFASFDCDYSKYPDKDFQLQWFDWYLTEYNGVKPSQEELEHLYKEVEGFSLASHFYWGIWALIQAKVSDIDFDYMNYAVLRFDEYERRKSIVFSSSAL
ncbi:hypothetical protein VTP01DRAFT_6455 [Rhizomucor pusillus]|uniref:uncharacterized protein n=1 Tax=Rhizomucor pusillus TaxID=4840 RepID=UPI0037447AB8